MHILLINHYAGSPELGMEFRPYYMAKEWVKAGHQVLIVGGSFSHLRKVQPQGKEDLIEGIHYRWVKLNAYKGNGIGRIRSMFSFVSRSNNCCPSLSAPTPPIKDVRAPERLAATAWLAPLPPPA